MALQYRMIQLARATFCWPPRATLMALLLLMGLLRLLASSAPSGRAKDEFQDLVAGDMEEQNAWRANKAEALWSMYYRRTASDYRECRAC